MDHYRNMLMLSIALLYLLRLVFAIVGCFGVLGNLIILVHDCFNTVPMENDKEVEGSLLYLPSWNWSIFACIAVLYIHILFLHIMDHYHGYLGNPGPSRVDAFFAPAEAFFARYFPQCETSILDNLKIVLAKRRKDLEYLDQVTTAKEQWVKAPDTDKRKFDYIYQVSDAQKKWCEAVGDEKRDLYYIDQVTKAQKQWREAVDTDKRDLDFIDQVAEAQEQWREAVSPHMRMFQSKIRASMSMIITKKRILPSVSHISNARVCDVFAQLISVSRRMCEDGKRVMSIRVWDGTEIPEKINDIALSKDICGKDDEMIISPSPIVHRSSIGRTIDILIPEWKDDSNLKSGSFVRIGKVVCAPAIHGLLNNKQPIPSRSWMAECNSVKLIDEYQIKEESKMFFELSNRIMNEIASLVETDSVVLNDRSVSVDSARGVGKEATNDNCDDKERTTANDNEVMYINIVKEEEEEEEEEDFERIDASTTEVDDVNIGNETDALLFNQSSLQENESQGDINIRNDTADARQEIGSQEDNIGNTTAIPYQKNDKD